MLLASTNKQSLGQTVLRFGGILQSLVALPCGIQLFCSAWLYFSHPYDVWYYFTTYVLATSACVGIIFTAAVQWKASTTTLQTLRLEIVKSVLATGLFIWVNPIRDFYDWKRLIVTGLAVLVLFYAPLNYAYVAWKNEKKAARFSYEDNRRPVYTDSPEQAPLLQERK